MSKLGFLYIDTDRSEITKKVNLISLIGPENIITEALYQLVGSFPFKTYVNGRDYAIPVSTEDGSEKSHQINDQLLKLYTARIDSPEDIVSGFSSEQSIEDIEGDDLVYDASDGAFDVDVSDLSNWVIVDLEVPYGLYTTDDYVNLRNALKSTSESKQLEFVED